MRWQYGVFMGLRVTLPRSMWGGSYLSWKFFWLNFTLEVWNWYQFLGLYLVRKILAYLILHLMSSSLSSPYSTIYIPSSSFSPNLRFLLRLPPLHLLPPYLPLLNIFWWKQSHPISFDNCVACDQFISQSLWRIVFKLDFNHNMFEQKIK